MNWLVRRFMDWWHGPTREKREVKQKATHLARVLDDYESQDRYMLVRKSK